MVTIKEPIIYYVISTGEKKISFKKSFVVPDGCQLNAPPIVAKKVATVLAERTFEENIAKGCLYKNFYFKCDEASVAFWDKGLAHAKKQGWTNTQAFDKDGVPHEVDMVELEEITDLATATFFGHWTILKNAYNANS